MSHSAKNNVEHYGALWPSEMGALEIEMTCIQKGGQWKNKKGETCGLGLFEHYMNFRQLVWPDRYRHRWTDLIIQNYLDNIVTILMGPASSQKTSGAVECVLIDWWCFPEETLVLLSTTKVEKLRMGIFGELQMLWQAGTNRFPWLAGNLINSQNAIAFDNLKEDGIRDMRKGMVGRALYSGSRYVGLGHWAGIKQKRIRFVGDELQFCDPNFLDVLPNMMASVDTDDAGDPNFKFVGSGNPKHDPQDPLSTAAEPPAGWKSVSDIEKTTVWKNRFHRGKTVNLIGIDSPNNDFPESVKPQFPRLISKNSTKLIETRWGKSSMQYYSQCVGKMMMNMVGNRVITMDLCVEHGAFNNVVWRTNQQTRIGMLDPSYSVNGDRCPWGWMEFGFDVEGKMLLSFGEYKVIPFLSNTSMSPEDQIAHFVQRECVRNSIEPINVGYDSTGKGTIGAAFARVFGDQVPVPIYFGGNATPRPVRHDLFVIEPNGTKRLKRCDEEYRKFVSELWFASRNVIECGQMRNLPEEVAKEGCMREYMEAPGGRLEVEPKADTKERMGCSPDLYDMLVTGVEIARQRGFIIERLGEEIIEQQPEDDYFASEAKKYQDAIKSKLLNHV